MLIREFFCRFRLNAKQSCRVDIGCGQGDLLGLGRPEFGLSTGCDVSSAMLRGCEGLTVLRQQQGDVLPFPGGFADFATAVCVYHHVPLSKRAAITREAARILKPGSTFCVIEHNPVNPVTRMVVKRSPVDMDARLLGIRETRRLLEERQFRIVWEPYFLFLPEPLYRRIGFIQSCLDGCLSASNMLFSPVLLERDHLQGRSYPKPLPSGRPLPAFCITTAVDSYSQSHVSLEAMHRFVDDRGSHALSGQAVDGIGSGKARLKDGLRQFFRGVSPRLGLGKHLGHLLQIYPPPIVHLCDQASLW
jgi:SAM-dependent methyltransferase